MSSEFCLSDVGSCCSSGQFSEKRQRNTEGLLDGGRWACDAWAGCVDRLEENIHHRTIKLFVFLVEEVESVYDAADFLSNINDMNGRANTQRYDGDRVKSPHAFDLGCSFTISFSKPVRVAILPPMVLGLSFAHDQPAHAATCPEGLEQFQVASRAAGTS